MFVTNSAARTPAQVAEKLASHGIPDAEPLVVTAAMAAASMVEPGERIVVIGGDGVHHALTRRGAVIVEAGAEEQPVDAVVAGIAADFDYRALTRAMRAIRGGARFIATNDDPTFPASDGLLPGNGALVAAIATAAETPPEIAGKPHAPIARLVRTMIGEPGLMVGDRPETDGRFAAALGYDFGLVLSGVVTQEDLPVEPAPRFVTTDLLAMVERVL